MEKEKKTFSSFKELRAATQPPQDMEPCPVCGYRKPKEITVVTRPGGETTKVRPLVCKGCSDRYHQYGAEVATLLAKGERVVVMTRHQWVLDRLDLARFAQELGEAFREKERLNEEVKAKLATHGRLPREVFEPLRDSFQKEIGAAAAYGKWRRLQERLKAATEVRPQVEKMIADEAAKNSPPPTTTATTKSETTPAKTAAKAPAPPKAVAAPPAVDAADVIAAAAATHKAAAPGEVRFREDIEGLPPKKDGKKGGKGGKRHPVADEND